MSPAQCEAGWTQAFRVELTVIRSAWSMLPEAASSKRIRPGKIGSPAASAEVYPSVRSAVERGFQITAESAFQCGRGDLRKKAR